MLMKTEFSDRSGKPLYVGDIVQHRLSLNSKHGGPVVLRVISTKKGIKLADARIANPQYGWLLRKPDERYLSLMDTSERIKD